MEDPRTDAPLKQVLPPPELRFRVAGTDDPVWFEESGRLGADDYEDALATLGQRLADFSAIFEFGAGCGRITRWLVKRAPGARIAASDIDAAAITWMREYMPGVDARLNDALPPLPFEADLFDLVLAFSVFTHLDESYQEAWLAELRRVTRPGAVLLLTVHGARNWDDAARHSPQLAAREAELDDTGMVFFTEDGWERYFPSYYHTSFHRPWYIHERWSRWFEVVDVLEANAQRLQDLVVLRRR
jgi:SAM-dependent methyltransferase